MVSDKIDEKLAKFILNLCCLFSFFLFSNSPFFSAILLLVADEDEDEDDGYQALRKAVMEYRGMRKVYYEAVGSSLAV